MNPQPNTPTPQIFITKDLPSLMDAADAIGEPGDDQMRAVIELLDDYHEGGEFHEYTPLEKQRYAQHVLAIAQPNVEAIKQREVTLTIVNLIKRGLFTIEQLDASESMK